MSFTAWARLAIEGDLDDGVTRELLDGGPHRSTWRVRNAGGESLVGKVDHPELRWPWLQRRLRRSRLRREAAALRHALRLDLPVPYPFGVERLDARREVLWLEDLGAVSPLDERFSPVFGIDEADDARRLELARAAGALLRRVLDAGVAHGDLHLGNLVARDHEALNTLHLLDLAKARFARHPVRLSPADRRSLFLSFPWPDQQPLRDALADALGEGPLEPDALDDVLADFVHRRVARCHRSSGPIVVDGTSRWRRVPTDRATSTRRLASDAALDEWEDRFVLEQHGVPVLRAVALDFGDPSNDARLECEDGSDGAPIPTDGRLLTAWQARLAASGHTLVADRVRLLRTAEGSLRADGLAVVSRRSRS